MTGLDTSFLVALSVKEHDRHERARALFREQARNEALVLTPDVVAEFIHAITDPRRFRQPFTMQEALNDARA